MSFRPIRLEEYDDTIQFFTEKGSFVVPIKAYIPHISSRVPENLDFGFCPCRETGTKTFQVVNDGEVPIEFKWTCMPPFTLSPRAGAVPAGGTATITARFQPTDACVYVAHCVCIVPGHTSHTMKLGGIGKYPFVAASLETIDFAHVPTAASETQHFKLYNKSLVYARWKVERRESDCEPVYAFSPTSGIIAPDGEQTIGVRYTPRVSGTFSHERYDVSTPGGNGLTVECRGEALGPEVEISRRVISFGDVPIVLPRKSVGRVLEILNHSDSPVPYQLHGVDLNGQFAMDKTTGVLQPRVSSYVNLSFSPLEPGNYYRRVYVLLRNAPPMVVDLIGSGYSDKRRPAPLQSKHITDYWRREQLGLHKLTPEEMGERAVTRREMRATAEDDYGGFLPADTILPQDGEATALAATGYEEGPDAEQLLMRSLFRGSGWAGGAVQLEEEVLDFGGAARLRAGEAKSVRLINHTSGKLVAHWVVPQGRKGEPPLPCFNVVPAMCDVPPHSSAVFRVQFRPTADQTYYSQNLECFVAFKSMRTFRLVGEDNFALPWCLPLACAGHTFPSGVPHFIPKPALSHATLSFPAVHAGDVGYQTISIKNDGDTPMLFQVRNDPSGVFSVRPSVGLVPRGETQLLAVRFAPPEVKRYARGLHIVLNTNTARPTQLHMHGSGTKAGLTLGSGSKVHCATTCVGATSRATLSLRNPSRLPLAYEWDVPPKWQSSLQVVPVQGLLRGHEEVQLEWFFTPQREGPMLAKVGCLVSALDDRPDGKPHEIARQQVQVSGVGAAGSIRAEPDRVDFGPVLVGTKWRRHMTLLNPSDVALYYQISYERRPGDAEYEARRAAEDELDGDDEGDAPLLSLTPQQGVLPARNAVELAIELNAPLRGPLVVALYATLQPFYGGRDEAEGAAEYGEPLGPPVLIGEVMADAQLPQLQVVDARLLGMAQEALWRQLRLPQVNAELAASLSEVEVQACSEEGYPTGGDPNMLSKQLKSIDCWLPPALHGAADTELTLLLENTGGLAVELSVKYPTEMDLEIEHWADTGEPTAIELKQHLMVDKGIIEVTPKQANMPPGGKQAITLRMRHHRADEYELPLLVALANGKQFVLNVKWRTLVPGEEHLHLPLREVRLPPTPIGLPHPSLHALELPNYGDVPLAFELELEELHALNEQSHGFPILQCALPSGAIPPRGTVSIPFHFHPLEPREYAVAITVLLGGGSRRALVLSAEGYNPNAPDVYEAHEAAQRALLPLCQALSLPRQPLRLSMDRALFSSVPFGSTSRQLLLLRNPSGAPCSFEWDAGHERWGSLLSVFPSRGSIGAGGHVCCKVTLLAESTSEEVDLALRCALRPHPSVEEDKSVSFKPAESRRGASQPEPFRRSVTETVPSLRGPRAVADLEERRTRGAGAASPDLGTRGGGGGGPAAAAAEPSALLTLGVRARVAPRAVLQAAGANLHTFHLQPDDPESPMEGGGPVKEAQPPQRAPPAGVPPGVLEERDAMEGVLAALLREVLGSRDVGRALETAEREPVPYFVQLAADSGRSNGAAVHLAGLGGEPPIPMWVPPPPPPPPTPPVQGGAEDLQAIEARMIAAREVQRAEAEARRKTEDAARAGIMGSTEFQEVVAYVLEGTLFNLVSEATHGEFSFDAVPRQIVRSLEIEPTEDGP